MSSPASRSTGAPAATSATTRATSCERVRDELPFPDEVDIESDDDLLTRYLERIPVVALDGEELYDFFVDEADLHGALARVGSHERR